MSSWNKTYHVIKPLKQTDSKFSRLVAKGISEVQGGETCKNKGWEKGNNKGKVGGLIEGALTIFVSVIVSYVWLRLNLPRISLQAEEFGKRRGSITKRKDGASVWVNVYAPLVLVVVQRLGITFCQGCCWKRACMGSEAILGLLLREFSWIYCAIVRM